MPALITRSIETAIASGDDRTISGHASVYDVVDHEGERVVRGAFRRALEAAQPIPIVWSHSQDSVPLGHAEVSEDDVGLAFTATIYEGAEGDRLLQAVKSGAVRGCSFGGLVYETRKSSDGRREYTDIDLVEISPCFRGANPMAEVSAKSLWFAAEQLMALARIRSDAQLVGMLQDDDTTPETQAAVAAEAEETERQVIEMIRGLGGRQQENDK